MYHIYMYYTSFVSMKKTNIYTFSVISLVVNIFFVVFLNMIIVLMVYNIHLGCGVKGVGIYLYV